MTKKKPRMGGKSRGPRLGRAAPKGDNKSRSNRHEARMEAPLRAKRQPNSGASIFITAKGDLKSTDFIWQLKLTQGGRLVLTTKDLWDVTYQARRQGRHPALQLTLEGLPSNLDAEWVCVPLHVWQEVVGDGNDGDG